jgi:hypothetical protein
VTKIDLDHAGVAKKLKAAEYRGEPCGLDPFETEAVVDLLKEFEALRAAVASFEPCDCGEGCCVDPINCSSLRARVETLEGALKPFARIADMEQAARPGSVVGVNIDRLRDARKALSPQQRDQP